MPRDWTSFKHVSNASYALYYGPQQGNVLNSNVPSGTLALVPFYPGVGGAVVRASVAIAAGWNQAAGYVRGAIYQSAGNSDLYPVGITTHSFSVIADVGCFSTQSAGIYTNSVLVILDPTRLYWLVTFMSTNLAAIRSGANSFPIAAAADHVPSLWGSYTCTNTLALWPDTIPTSTTVVAKGGNNPHFWVEVDSL
jgi:hypothetical protein